MASGVMLTEKFIENLQLIVCMSSTIFSHFFMKTEDHDDIFFQSIDCGYTLECLTKAVLTSTHNLCFG